VHRDSAWPYHLYMIPMQLALPGPGANQFGSQPVIKRLERNARRWQLVRSRWIYEVPGSSVCPACFVTHAGFKIILRQPSALILPRREPVPDRPVFITRRRRRQAFAEASPSPRRCSRYLRPSASRDLIPREQTVRPASGQALEDRVAALISSLSRSPSSL
jgi:hypothetical protein